MSKVRALTEQGKTLREVLELTKKCKKICRAEGITQQQLADLIGVTQSNISYQFKNGASTELLCVVARLTGRKLLEKEEDLGI